VKHHVVGDHEGAGLEPLARQREQLLVEPVRRVEEDDVEHVADRGERLSGIAFDEQRRLLELCAGDVPAPVRDAALVALEREDAAAEVADSRSEPDGRVAATGPDLEHLAVGLRRDEREEKPARRRSHRHSGRSRLLRLEPLEHAANAVVQHAAEPILLRVRAELTIEIARSPEDVFAYLTDVSNLPAWQSGLKSATAREGRVEETRSFLGRELRTTLEIVEREEPRLFTLRALDSPVPFSVRHELEPSGGGTRLTVRAEGNVPGFAAGLVAQRAKSQFRKDFARLKEILESA